MSNPQDLDATNFSVSAMEAMDREAARPRPNPLPQHVPPPRATLPRQSQKLVQEKLKMEKESEEIQKKRLISTINLYMDRFPMLASKVPRLTQKTSLREAEEILDIIRETMNTANSCHILAEYLNTGFTVLEGVWGDGSKMTRLPEPLRFNVKGISELFREGKFPELNPLIMEIDIEYPWLGRRPLLFRFCQALGSIITKVHLFNTNPAAASLFKMENMRPVDVDIDGL